MNIDWTDQASRFAYSDWLEEHGRLHEAEMARSSEPPPVELRFGDFEGRGSGDGWGYGYGFEDGEGVFAGQGCAAGATADEVVGAG